MSQQEQRGWTSLIRLLPPPWIDPNELSAKPLFATYTGSMQIRLSNAPGTAYKVWYLYCVKIVKCPLLCFVPWGVAERITQKQQRMICLFSQQVFFLLLLLSAYFSLGAEAGIGYPLVQKPNVILGDSRCVHVLVSVCWEMVIKPLNAQKYLFIFCDNLWVGNEQNAFREKEVGAKERV